MFETSWPGRLSILKAPYRTFVPTNGGPPPARYVQGSVPRGMALVWNLGDGILREDRETVQTRPYGMALVAVLPPAHRLRPVPAILDVVDQCRPQSILPHHRDLRPEEIARVLRRPPADLASELIGYLSWRGVEIEHDTRHLVRRTIELSAELRSVAALSRAVYLSRRALGRRLCRAKLPVPSHWLHFGRLLRIAIQLQNSDHNLFRVGWRIRILGRVLAKQPDVQDHRHSAVHGEGSFGLGMDRRVLAPNGGFQGPDRSSARA